MSSTNNYLYRYINDGSTITTLDGTGTTITKSDSTSSYLWVGAGYSNYWYKGYMDDLFISDSFFSEDYCEAMMRQLRDKDGYRSVSAYESVDLPDLEFTIEFGDFAKSIKGFDEIQYATISLSFYTSHSVATKVDLYNYADTSYDSLVNSIYTTNTLITINILNIDDYLDGDEEFYFKFYILDYTINFDLFIDYIGIEIFYESQVV